MQQRERSIPPRISQRKSLLFLSLVRERLAIDGEPRCCCQWASRTKIRCTAVFRGLRCVHIGYDLLRLRAFVHRCNFESRRNAGKMRKNIPRIAKLGYIFRALERRPKRLLHAKGRKKHRAGERERKRGGEEGNAPLEAVSPERRLADWPRHMRRDAAKEREREESGDEYRVFSRLWRRRSHPRRASSFLDDGNENFALLRWNKEPSRLESVRAPSSSLHSLKAHFREKGCPLPTRD